MITVLTIIFFVFGTIIGSFLNVVIFRYNTERNLGGRSACMNCRKELAWYELFPVLSYLALRGRCRRCRTKISIQYPLVEITSGLIFAALFWKFQVLFFFSTGVFALSYAYWAALFSLLLVITVYDIRHKIIPDPLALSFGILAFIGLFFFSSLSPAFHAHVPLWRDLLAGAAVSVPFALIWLASRGRWMGLGDAKLSVGLGFMLGLSRILTATVLAFWAGALAGIFLLIASRARMKTQVPFAPFLVLGALITFIFEIHLFPF